MAESGCIAMISPEEGAYAFGDTVALRPHLQRLRPTIGAPWLAALVGRTRLRSLSDAVSRLGGHQHARGQELRTLPQDEWPTRLGRLVAEQAGLILRRAVDPDRPFPDHGLDSLGNLELRTRIETETGIRVTRKAIATHNTARALARHLSDTLSAELTV